MQNSVDMAKRQRVLADFGEFALGSDDLDEVLTEACRLVAGTLGTQRAKILEIQEDGRQLLLRAGVGWERDVVGRLRLSMSEASSETFAITAGTPVITRDIRSEERFVFADFMKAEGVRALVNVPIFVPGRRAYGILQVDATEPRDFTGEDIEFLRTYAIVLGPVIDRLHKMKRLRDAEAREQAREVRFRNVFDTAPVGLAIVDADGRFRRVNKELARILGRAEHELVSVSAADVTHGPDVEPTLAAFRRSLESGETSSLDKHYRRPSGELVPANSTLTPLQTSDGSPAVLAVTVDLTARHRAEQALRENEALLRGFGEASSDVLWIRDADSLHWTYLTPAFETVYGMSRDDALAGNDLRRWAELIVPEDRDRALDAMRRVRDGEKVQFEYRIRRPADGRVRWLRNTDFPILDENGRVVGIGGIGHDVTVEKEASSRTEVLLAELQHRTRNLIAVVRATADRTAAGAADLGDFLPRFRDRLGALARINGLLSKLEGGERIAFDEMLRSELGARGVLDDAKGERIFLDGPAGIHLRSSTVQTFALAIHELATNAVKYGALSGEVGRLRVIWRLKDDEAGTDRLQVEWIETGVADMPEEGATPRGGGYGRMLIEKALPYQLQAQTTYALTTDGVRCTIDLPLR